MAVEFTGRNVEVTSSLRELAEERTQRLERHLGGPADVRVVLSHEKHRFGAEVIAKHRRRRWTAQEKTADPRAAMAAAFEKIDAQAMRDSAKQRDKKHRALPRAAARGARGPEPVLAAAPVRERGNGGPRVSRARGSRSVRTDAFRSVRTDALRVVRSSPLSVKPMGVDEAALAMESTGEDVLVFRDATSNRVSVLYRRRDGDLGLVVPEC